MRCDHLLTAILLLLLAAGLPAWRRQGPSSVASAVGVNWGRSSSQPLPPATVVPGLLLANSVRRVKLADAEPSIMESLAGTGIGVMVGIPNEALPELNASMKAAESWIHDNVTRYIAAAANAVRIEYIAVGDEPFLVKYGPQFAPFVIGAAANIRLALMAAKLINKIKVVIPCASDAFLSDSGLPSEGRFRPDLNKTMAELLPLLAKQGSPFVVDINPYSSYGSKYQNKSLSMDYVLFRPNARPVADGHFEYLNSFDSIVDTLVSSLSKLGFGEMDVVVGRVGWPTDGAANATPSVAEEYMKGLVDHLQGSSGRTPLRPKRPLLETYLFSLLDEDERSIASGDNYERHWGIFTFDGQAKYNVDLGQGSRDLVNAQNVDYLPSKWCVATNSNDSSDSWSAAVSEACSVADCTALSIGGSCSGIGWPGNVSYALNSYFQRNGQGADSCDFGGVGMITVVDPTVGGCRFPVGIRMSSAAPVIGFLLWEIILFSGFCISFILTSFS